MRVKINSEQQIQRINLLISLLEDYKKISKDQLVQRPTEKSWSILEIIKHTSIAHRVYETSISGTLNEVNSSDTKKLPEIIKCSYISSMLIKRFPPKDGKVRLKMKTMKKFEPLLDINDVNADEIFQENMTALEQLKSWINEYRMNNITRKRFNSAVGPVIRFNIPEACEFILSHNERHFHQIKKTLESVQSYR